MQFIEKMLHSVPEYRELKNAVTNRKTVATGGLSHIHKAVVLSELLNGGVKKAMLITSSAAEAERFFEDLTALGKKCLIFPSRDYSPRDEISHSTEYEQKRLGTLSEITDGDFGVLIVTADSAVSRTVPPEIFKANRFTLRSGDEVSVDSLVKKLLLCGYTRCEAVESEGQFSVRGGIVDIFSPGSKSPCRIDFWGDEIDTLSLFDSDSQRRTKTVDSLTVSQVRECVVGDSGLLIEKIEKETFGKLKHGENYKQTVYRDIDGIKSGVFTAFDRYIHLIYDKFSTVLDYFDGSVFLSEFSSVETALKGAEKLYREDIISYIGEGLLSKKSDGFMLPYKDFIAKIGQRNPILLENFSKTKYPWNLDGFVGFSLKQTMPISVSSNVLYDELKADSGLSVVLAGNERAAVNLNRELNDNGIKSVFAKDWNSVGDSGVFVTVGGLSSGFETADGKFKVITHGAVIRRKRKSKYKKGIDIGSLEELKKGDLVVHAHHGIGSFDGVQPMTTQGITKDYIKIKYLGSDVLYVPVTSLDLVSRYIGSSEDSTVKLNRLGSPQWKNARNRVKNAVKDIAKQLTALYAKRLNSKGFAFSSDNEMQKDFEMRFKYDETDDQIRSAEEIKRDMEQPYPMDRLLCGDVGFGKTEVALRAAFKCINDGKQCAILVPTTILAWQHFMTATERFKGLPVKVEMISRFRTAKQQTEIKKDLKKGFIDIIIGTHRLVSKDIEFKNLGLLIVDEEQRFGVEQKEKLKEKYPTVDVLTLSATPIPRTLNMALSGLRDMSSIEEAPQDRLPVQTYVCEQDGGIITEAINRELRRGGQVFYLYNRVESIERRALEIKRAFPDSNIAVAHGKMGEDELEKVWRDMLEHNIDILVCTTIIETGVDIQNANTLIVEDADRMGLSQLHQLRGRVGRSHRRAFAYLLFKKGKALSDISQKRLTAIREFTEFGSGFKIAMRDLEIRGAGNVLGGEQHGHMESVGYDLYVKMLNDAIKEEKGETVKAEKADCLIDFKLDAHIPEKYIEAFSQRISMYRRIAGIETEEDRQDVTDELIDRFGEPPGEVMDLMKIALIRSRASDCGISEIKERNGTVEIGFYRFSPEYLNRVLSKFGQNARFRNSAKPYLSVKIAEGDTAMNTADKILSALGS